MRDFLKIVLFCLIFSFNAYSNNIKNTPSIYLTDTKRLYNIVDTNQKKCFDSYGEEIPCNKTGQDGDYYINLASYTKNNDGTITDNITGLLWQKSIDTNKDDKININDKMTQKEAIEYCDKLSLGGFDDWRLPDIKTLYSLIDFRGQDINPRMTHRGRLNPFIDNFIFDMAYGDLENGERIIDAQWASSTNYVSTTMNGNKTMFGVNFADGRIKGYPKEALRRGQKKFYVQCVRDNEDYGKNNFEDNNDGTITDIATGLIWQKDDSKKALEFEDAIKYCKNLDLAGENNWRVPNAKELHSIVDYTKSPDTSNSPAIDTKYFLSTKIINEAAQDDWGSYWSNTTHKSMRSNTNAVYINFGRALGYFHRQWIDVHGAGSQRSDPKTLDLRFDRSYKEVLDKNGKKVMVHGPQGDVIRGMNFVRCVR